MRFTPNIPLDRCLELITEYKLTNNCTIFHQLHAKFDLLLLSTIHRLARRFPHLKAVSMQELYHCSILGMEHAFLRMPVDEDPNKIPAWIVAYIKARIRADFKWNTKEELHSPNDMNKIVESRGTPKTWYGYQNDMQDKIDMLDIDELFKKAELDPTWERAIRMRYFDGMTEKEISLQLGLTKRQVRWRIEMGVDRLRDVALSDR